MVQTCRSSNRELIAWCIKFHIPVSVIVLCSVGGEEGEEAVEGIATTAPPLAVALVVVMTKEGPLVAEVDLEVVVVVAFQPDRWMKKNGLRRVNCYCM